MPNFILPEIRINPSYIQLLESEYPQNTEDNTGDSDSIPKIRKSVTSTQTYLKKFSENILQKQTYILPPNCRFIEKFTNNYTIVVIEEPPAYRTIKICYPMEQEISRLKNEGRLEEWNINTDYYLDKNNYPFSFNLAFPYVIFIMMFDSNNYLHAGQAFVRPARLSGFADYLMKIPLPNISSDQYICYGDATRKDYKSLAEAIENTIMVFWSASFNTDYGYNYTAYKNVAGVHSYISWQELSKINPMFIYNVEWLKYEKNLKQAIDEFKTHFRVTGTSNLEYKELEKIFSRPTDTGKECALYNGCKTKHNLFYDVAQGMILFDSYINVGDPLLWGNHTAFIDSFIGLQDSASIKFIRLVLDNKKLITIKLTRDVKNYIGEGIKYLRFQETATLKNGFNIKTGDIISIKYNNSTFYKKVQYIRRTRDGITEAKLGNSFYILENIEGEKIDFDKPMYNGFQMEKGKKYIYVKSTAVNKSDGIECIYDTIDISSQGNLSLLLRETNTNLPGAERKRFIDFNPSEPVNFFPIEQVRKLPNVFRIAKSIVTQNIDNKKNRCSSWVTPVGLVLDYNLINVNMSPDIYQVQKHLLLNDETVFHLESSDLDINFSVGEKVVVANWQNPIDMLTTKTIMAFKIDKTSPSLSFVLTDKLGNISQVPYIINVDNKKIVNIGKIRKIIDKHGEIISGSKIIAKTKVSHFPKKDVNIIIGFITDTGTDNPLVLCSNCCTIWYNDLIEKFDIIPITSKKWSKLQHTPIDISKIKLQPGDMVKFKSTSYRDEFIIALDYLGRPILVNNTSFAENVIRNQRIDTYIKDNIILDCIITPRISITEQKIMHLLPGIPNFHGRINKNIKSKVYFLHDERNINV